MNIKEIDKLLMGATIKRYNWRKDEWEFFEVKEVAKTKYMQFVQLRGDGFSVTINLAMVLQLKNNGQCMQYAYMEDSWYAITVKDKEEEE